MLRASCKELCLFGADVPVVECSNEPCRPRAPLQLFSILVQCGPNRMSRRLRNCCCDVGLFPIRSRLLGVNTIVCMTFSVLPICPIGEWPIRSWPVCFGPTRMLKLTSCRLRLTISWTIVCLSFVCIRVALPVIWRSSNAVRQVIVLIMPAPFRLPGLMSMPTFGENLILRRLQPWKLASFSWEISIGRGVLVLVDIGRFCWFFWG